MERSDLCIGCGSDSFTRDPDSESLYCDGCGRVQEFDSYDAQLNTINGPTGNLVRYGKTGLGYDYSYRDRKFRNAEDLIDQTVTSLGLPDLKLIEVRSMVSRITEGEYGDAESDWFPVLVGACCYVVMRNDEKDLSLTIVEVAGKVRCGIYEMGRMVNRVVDHLGLKLQDFDVVGVFERAVNTSSCLMGFDQDVVEGMRKQGVFLLQCCVKWFLTTGRQPVPMVVALLFFVGKLNRLAGLKIEVLAKDMGAKVATCRKRYKELLETFLKVGQALPWGKDITVKNVLTHAPYVIRYMEMKSLARPGEKGKRSFLEGMSLDMGELVNECLKKDEGYGEIYRSNVEEYDSKYYEVGDKSEVERLTSVDNVDERKIPHESLATIYKNFLKNVAGARNGGEKDGSVMKRKRDYDTSDSPDWWTGESELSQKQMLEDTLDIDVGWDDALPPSYVSGCEDYAKRRERIKAAKSRIELIMNPSSKECVQHNTVSEENQPASQDGKRDWEDLIIESLLLHNVREEEIEKGHYNVLLDLYVSNVFDLEPQSSKS